MANDIRWNPISVNFGDASAFMNNANNSFSKAGTVFGELRKQILEKEQRDIENEYKNRALQQTIDAEKRLHDYRMATAEETNRHNQATEAYYRGMLDYHNAHLRAQTELGQERNRILQGQLNARAQKGEKTRQDGGNYSYQDLFPAENSKDNKSLPDTRSLTPSSPSPSPSPSLTPSPSQASASNNEETIKAWNRFFDLAENAETKPNLSDAEKLASRTELEQLRKLIPIDNFENDPLAQELLEKRAAQLEAANSPLISDDNNDDNDIVNPNMGNLPVTTNASSGSSKGNSEDTWERALSKNYTGNGLFAKDAEKPHTPKEHMVALSQWLATPIKPIADAAVNAYHWLNPPTTPQSTSFVYGDNLITGSDYKNLDEAYKSAESARNSTNYVDFSHLTENEQNAINAYGRSNNNIRNFGDRWFANTFFGSADAITLSNSATENKAQHELRTTKELAALKQIYSSGDSDLQQFVLGRLKQGAKSANPEVAAKCKAGYMYLNSALNDKEYGTSVGGLQALDSMYADLRFPTKESASSVKAYQEERTKKAEEQIKKDRRLTSLMQNPLDYSKFGGNKASLDNAEYKNLRKIVNEANHTNVPESWGYGKTNPLARAAALQLTLNQLNTKDKWFFGNVINANDSALEFYQHAGNLKFFNKNTTEGSLFHEYYRMMYNMTPSEIREYLQSVQSSGQSNK